MKVNPEKKSRREEPLVSVIVNCLNGEKFLREALDSIYAQTYENWEIIFWDNASSDRSAEIAQSFGEKLVYYRSKKTEILGEARVKATKEAKGQYIAFLDCDDIWLEEKLEKQVASFCRGENQVGFVYCRTKVIYDDKAKRKSIFKESEILPEGNIFKELTKKNFIYFSSVMVDKDKFYLCGGFPRHFLNSTDYYVFLRLAKQYKCMAIQETCCKVRVHDENLSYKQGIIGAEESVQALRQFLPDVSVKTGLRIQYTNLAIMHLRQKDILYALYILVRDGDLLYFFARLYHALMNYKVVLSSNLKKYRC